MQYRKFGRTGWEVSEIGFGGWGIGKGWWGTVDDRESVRALQTAYEAGINFFDTAYVYGDGHSEGLIGKTLKGKEIFIATKIPPKNHIWPGEPSTPLNATFPKDWIISCTERSLKNLDRDFVDLTQFHVWSDGWLKYDEWKEAAAQLKKEGKIKAFGVSINDHDPDSALEIVNSGLVDSVQVIFNIFDQSPTERLFPLCKKREVAVIVRVPFDEGGLTGTLSKETKFEEGDFRREYFSGEKLAQTVRRVEKLKSFLGGEAKTMPDLALKFILSHEAVSVVIPGMRKAKHVSSNVAVSGSKGLKTETVEALRGQAWKRNYYV